MLGEGINIPCLMLAPGGQSRIKWTAVAVSSSLHLGHQLFVAAEEGGKPPAPTTCFGMIDVPDLVLGKNGPKSVKLPMLTEQVLATEVSRRHIPYSQDAVSSQIYIG